METLNSLTKQKAFYSFLLFAIFSITSFIDSTLFSQTWNPLSLGTNGNVYACAEYNNNLVVAGDFTTAGGVTVNHIARWNGTAWLPLGSGTDNSVFSLSVFNGQLIASGKFMAAGGNVCNRVAAWDGTSWIPLGIGVNDVVYSSAVYGGNLRIGGAFTDAGGVPCSHVARWDGTNWFPMPLGVNDIVYSMSLFGADLILAGKFTSSGGIFTLRRIARYNVNGLYAPLGNGMDSGSVFAVDNYSGSLVAGGSFTSIGGIAVAYVALWDGTNWYNLDNGTNAPVYSFGSYVGNLIVGGLFNLVNGSPANHIAGWNGANWFSIGSGMNGGTTNIFTITTWSNILIGAGNFTTAGGNGASNIAAYGSLPVAPILLNPCSVQNDSLTPLLTWSPVNNATTYGLQISLDPNFLTTVLNVSSIPVTQYQIASGVLQPGFTYFWRVNAANGLGIGPWSLVCYFSTANLLGMHNQNGIPHEFKLYQNFPNPFNPTTKIKFDLPIADMNSKVQLRLYDLEGKEVELLYNENYFPGSHEIDLNADNLASGVYFYKITAGNFVQTNKMIIIK